MKRSLSEAITALPLRKQYIYIFFMLSILIIVVNVFVYFEISTKVYELSDVYKTNDENTALLDEVTKVQEYVTKYLETKNTEDMENYYKSEESLNNFLAGYINEEAEGRQYVIRTDIVNLIKCYLGFAHDAVDNKRGRDVQAYSDSYEKATTEYGYINDYIYALNTEQFRSNSEKYDKLRDSLGVLFIISMLLLLFVINMGVIIMFSLTRHLTRPLVDLSEKAEEISRGNFDVEVDEMKSSEEIVTLSHAFGKMLGNIKENIEKEKKQIEEKRAAKERELVMEAKIKEAQFNYLQNQVNPHFLFNTLNAGVQLAMLEGAGRTSDFISNVAEFFRYNLKKDDGTTSLYDEILLVDYYMAILKVRFGDEVVMNKKLDDRIIGELQNISVPKMILQPIVENCVNHGIRAAKDKGEVNFDISLEADNLVITISDDGVGMKQSLIDSILDGTYKGNESSSSNGVGLMNVISRLELYYGRKNMVKIESAGDNMGTAFVITIPYEKREDNDV